MNELFSSDSKVKRVVDVVGCGGFGGDFAERLANRLPGQAGIGYRWIDTDRPARVPSTAFVQVRPDYLPDEPDARIIALLKDLGVTPEKYRQWKLFTGAAGVSRLPFLAYIAALYRIDDLVSGVENDFRALSSQVGGAGASWLVTISSALGGTGGPSARASGLAFRLASHAIAPEARWLHLVISSTLVPEAVLTRRTRALEHRHFVELQALMQPGATLSIPGRRAAVDRPGPDFLWLLASSAEAPRTLDDGLEEVAALLNNFVTV